MVQNAGPRPLVVCGPSGSGKSTLLRRLLDDYPNTFGFSVSHTTRSPRPGERDGIDYHYVSKETMRAAIANGEFLEYAVFGGNTYGTSKQAVEDVRRTGKVCLLDIEIQGVKQIRGTSLDPLMVFVRPPSLEELERRLRGRGTESEESLGLRLQRSREEIEYGETAGNFNFVLTNDDVDTAYSIFKEFVFNELEKQRAEGERVVGCSINGRIESTPVFCSQESKLLMKIRLSKP